MQCFRNFIPNGRTLESTKHSCKRRNKGSAKPWEHPSRARELAYPPRFNYTICLHPCSSANANISRHEGCLFQNLRRLSCFSSSSTRAGYSVFLFSASRTHDPYLEVINRTKTTNSITNPTRVQCIDINE